MQEADRCGNMGVKLCVLFGIYQIVPIYGVCTRGQPALKLMSLDRDICLEYKREKEKDISWGQ